MSKKTFEKILFRKCENEMKILKKQKHTFKRKYSLTHTHTNTKTANKEIIQSQCWDRFLFLSQFNTHTNTHTYTYHSFRFKLIVLNSP